MRPVEGIGVVVEGRLARHPILIARPRAEVDQAATIRAERPPLVLRHPLDVGAAGRALDHAGFAGRGHQRLQKEILKNNINYCFL